MRRECHVVFNDFNVTPLMTFSVSRMQHGLLAFPARLREVLPPRLHLRAAGPQLVFGQLGGALHRAGLPPLPPGMPDVLRAGRERMSLVPPAQSPGCHFLLAPKPGAAKISQHPRAPAQNNRRTGGLAGARGALEIAGAGGGAQLCLHLGYFRSCFRVAPAALGSSRRTLF